jgi:pSer/pThr/pTyr-binding forkhead associated (FHA) protein
LKVKLSTVDPWGPKLRVVVKDVPTVVGRNPDVDVRVTDPWVSRVHCELYDLEGTLVVRDLGSRHGTFINGLKIAEAVVLPGDTLTLGMTRLDVAYKRQSPNLPKYSPHSCSSRADSLARFS